MFGIFGSPNEAGKVKDPVCKMNIDEQSKYSLEYKGKKYYFCSEDCQKKFAKVQEANTCGCCH